MLRRHAEYRGNVLSMFGWASQTQHTDPQGRDGVGVFVASVLLLQVVALGSLVSLADFPQLDGFICQKEEKGKHARKVYHCCCSFRRI